MGIVTTSWQAIRATKAEQLAKDHLSAEQVARDQTHRAQQAEAQQRVAAEQQRDRAEANLGLATAERQRAELNLNLAMDALNDLYLEAIGRDRLLGDWDREETRRELSAKEKTLIEAGLDFYAQIADQNEESTAATFQAASAFLQIAMLQANLDEMKLRGKADFAMLSVAAQEFRKLVDG